MEDERDAFYVVRKGDVIGIYKSFSDCQAQAGFSVCNPPVSVYKGYGLTKEAEQHLASHGLKGSMYSVAASDVKEDLLGNLVPCPFQQPSGGKVSGASPSKRLKEDPLESTSVPRPHIQNNSILGANVVTQAKSPNCVQDPLESTSVPRPHSQSNSIVGANAVTPAKSPNCRSCIIEFDGASKGNPGPAGAGAVLRAEDRSVILQAREGVGISTNNVAEYRAVILGLKCALEKGFRHVRVYGDSMLVCMQVQGLWKINKPNLAALCKEAIELKDKFLSFQISQVPRESNAAADAQANLGIHLRDGQVEKQYN